MQWLSSPFPSLMKKSLNKKGNRCDKKDKGRVVPLPLAFCHLLLKVLNNNILYRFSRSLPLSWYLHFCHSSFFSPLLIKTAFHPPLLTLTVTSFFPLTICFSFLLFSVYSVTFSVPSWGKRWSLGWGALAYGDTAGPSWPNAPGLKAEETL